MAIPLRIDRGCDGRDEAEARGCDGGDKDEREIDGEGDCNAGDGNNGGDNILFSSDTDKRGSTIDAFFSFIFFVDDDEDDDNDVGKHWGRLRSQSRL